MAKQQPIIHGVDMTKVDLNKVVQKTEPVIEPVVQSADVGTLAASEAFMHEPVTILIHESADENQANHVVLNVNGLNQPVLRGRPSTIKRKFLEVLARMKETRYTQNTPDPRMPDQWVMKERSGLAYPFDLVEDANPKGREWLRHILAEPAM